MKINALLFDNFETLDIFGPIEILSRAEGNVLHYYSQNGGIVTNAQGVRILTEPVWDADEKGILVVPGGRGTRELVSDREFLCMLADYARQAEFCLSICTGSALLAACGALDGKRATSNKRAMNWVKSVSADVKWIDKARWVSDGKFYTSSGVSAGMDMSLGFVSDTLGRTAAEEIADAIEYVWNDDPSNDIFYK